MRHNFRSEFPHGLNRTRAIRSPVFSTWPRCTFANLSPCGAAGAVPHVVFTMNVVSCILRYIFTSTQTYSVSLRWSVLAGVYKGKRENGGWSNQINLSDGTHLESGVAPRFCYPAVLQLPCSRPHPIIPPPNHRLPPPILLSLSISRNLNPITSTPSANDPFARSISHNSAVDFVQ